jgi:hypothetical protein
MMSVEELCRHVQDRMVATRPIEAVPTVLQPVAYILLQVGKASGAAGELTSMNGTLDQRELRRRCPTFGT